MDATSSLSALKAVYADTFNLPLETEFENWEYRNPPEWDSLAHVTLVLAIETAFNILLKSKEVISLSSFKRAQEILISHGIEFKN